MPPAKSGRLQLMLIGPKVGWDRVVSRFDVAPTPPGLPKKHAEYFRLQTHYIYRSRDGYQPSGDVKWVRLTRTEYDLLRTLAINAGKVLLHRQLLQSVWGPEYGEETEYLRTFVKQLRRKLEDDPSRPRLILTEPGIGYRLFIGP